MKRFSIFCCLVVMTVNARSQLTLEKCYEWAQANYPLIRQYDLVEKSSRYTVSNAAKGYLPQISVSGGAYAFTDLLESDGPSAMAGDAKNHVFNGSVQVNQSLYDGGAIAANRLIARAQAEVDKQQLDVNLYAVKDRVLQLYFGILTLDEQLVQTALRQDNLRLTDQTVEGLVRGGLANQSDRDAIRVEMLKAEQARNGLSATRQSFLNMLGIFIGKKLAADTKLLVPEKAGLNKDASANYRPELSYFQSKNLLLDAQVKRLNAQIRPRLSAFALGMYHSTVSRLMKDNLLAAGVSLSWSPSAWYTRKNDLHKIALQRQQIEVEKDVFLFNNQLQNENTDGRMADLEQKIKLDEEIVRLQENQLAITRKRLENGLETVNEVLRKVNAVSEAKQAKALHEISLLQEIHQYKNNQNQ